MKDHQAEEAPEDSNGNTEITELQLDTLSGDLRDYMLLRVRDMKSPWSTLSEDDQRDLANGLEQGAKDIVRRTVRLLSAYEFPKTAVKLDDIKIVGGDKARIEGKVTAANVSSNREVLGDAAGEMVMLVAVDSETFFGERAPAEIDPDQPELPTGEADAKESAIPSDMMRKARDVILKERKASTSLVQRRLGIGYNKAAKIIEALEDEGFLSPPDSTGKRTIIGEDDEGGED